MEHPILFLDPNKPIRTCVSDSCGGCVVEDSLHCHFRPQDLVHFLSISLPGLIVGGAGIYQVQGWFLAPWIALMVLFFGFLEIRVMCSHCPHYAEPGKSLKCWANYGSPKLWTYRPGPMSVMEKLLFLGGLAAIWAYPLIFLVMGPQWLLLVLYCVSAAGLFMTLKMFLCTRCMNFACPLNAAPEATRQDFFERNPEIAQAWGVEAKN
jgi:hypothetical protein